MLRSPVADNPYDWGVVIRLGVVHVMGLPVTIMYLVLFGCSAYTVILAVVFFFSVHLSISAGMHRLYAHQAYSACRALEVFLLAFSAAALQGPAVWWAGMHRRHHRHTDQPEDPYSVYHGFWWAHVFCTLHTQKKLSGSELGGLLRNRLLLFQAKHYELISIGMGLLLPTALGVLWGDALGGLLVVGFMRIAVQYHLTWIINSVAHTFGARRYPGTGTPRTNGWLGLVTVGESYHERHHLADQDYRLGNRWYDIDPTKWFIWVCAKLGLAYSLKVVSEDEVMQRAHKALSAPV